MKIRDMLVDELLRQMLENEIQSIDELVKNEINDRCSSIRNRMVKPYISDEDTLTLKREYEKLANLHGKNILDINMSDFNDTGVFITQSDITERIKRSR